MARFTEGNGGDIWGPTGKVVARVHVESLRTDEASKMTKAVIAALEAEFPDPAKVEVRVGVDDTGQLIADVVKAATPSIIKATRDIERRGGR